MWKMNRKNRYEVIKEIISKASPKLIDELVSKTDFRGYNPSDDPEYRRRELLAYLEELNNYWNENNIDMTDRQYIKIEEPNRPTRSSVCVIFKDAEEEQKFSEICEEVNYGKRIEKGHPKTYKKEI